MAKKEKVKKVKIKSGSGKKPIYKKWWFWLLVIVLLGSAAASGDKNEKKDATPSAASDTSTSVTATVEPTETPVRENPLDSISISKEDRISVYTEYHDLLLAPGSPELDPEVSGDDVRAFEDSVADDLGKKYGISGDDVKSIYTNATYGYLYDYDPSVLLDDKIIEASVVDTALVIKAKVSSSYSNKATIDQNYFLVADLIKNHDADQFESISYWAVGDMRDGEESKVISFSVPKETSRLVKEQKIVPEDMGDFVDDIWILPSLQ